MKLCREKVRQAAGPREEGGRGATLREWEKLVFNLIFIWTWDDIEVAICMFILGSL